MWLLTAIQKGQPSTDAATGMPSHRKPMGGSKRSTQQERFNLFNRFAEG